MGYRGKSKGSGYGQNRTSHKGFSSSKGSDFTSRYVRGEVSEATWRKHMNAERRSNAPSFDSILETMQQRGYAAGAVKNDTEGYQGWTNWDTWETMLILQNCQPSYKWLEAWKKNFATKIKQGKFNPEMAELVVKKYLVPVARGTKKPFFYDQYHEFTPDANIDPKKVNAAEIIHNLLSDYKEEMEYAEKKS